MKRKITNTLIGWKEQGVNRLPLVLSDARQVVKTYIVEEFGAQYYKNMVYVNFEQNPALRTILEDDCHRKELYADEFKGAITENYVAQALASSGYDLYYWESDSRAEIDFIIVRDGQVIPIEAKASINTKSKSLGVYAERYNPPYSIRVSAKNFGFENGIKSVPLYAVFAI